MNTVRGGFTAHDPDLGWRGSCACGWVGPWRGSSLTLVEEDVMEHWGNDRCDQGKRRPNRTDVRPACGTLKAENECSPHRVCAQPGSVAQTYEGGPSMADDTTATRVREGGDDDGA